MKKYFVFLASLFSVPFASMAQALVEKDATTGEIVFNPGVIVDPIVLAILAVIGTVTSIWVIIIGVRWILRYAKGRA